MPPLALSSMQGAVPKCSGLGCKSSPQMGGLGAKQAAVKRPKPKRAKANKAGSGGSGGRAGHEMPAIAETSSRGKCHGSAWLR